MYEYYASSRWMNSCFILINIVIKLDLLILFNLTDVTFYLIL